ncbi:putative trans-sialidase, Group V [Trypanosoma cruzi]|uniref:Trans-sialidase, putative n=2 Tax=Trypanosoma cruzi TaxID=5693 RepID=Q4DMA7_TRYCC|nr:trans-sialidase, putative [Trypanosoma cruzi]EAN93660.1 trans-sialidase, putative [Trypanosoma cruzi]PWV11592.1 putative trans-sialidase, Group V [Trypanosoma cruzi]|eukprot:XP_815511.1 trans-sialidase [Trypanosoma cruzi strain CL Brener]
MHSRVAAVKAPRTHNRRRVTGSGRRRREGRESEPPRPNMSRHVFTSAVLLLVVMMCCSTGGAASSKETLSGSGSSPKPPFAWRDTTADETVSSLRVPSLFEMNDGVFAVAEAQCTKGGSGFTGIASELLTLTDDKPKEDLEKTKLKTQVPEGCIFEGGKCPAGSEEKCACRIAGQDDSQSKTKVHVSRPTTVVKGSDIYMLAGNYSWAYAENYQAVGWGLMLVKGHVSGENQNDKRIYWNDTYAIPWTYKGNQHSILKRLIGGGGSGVKMKDDTLVFPLEGTKKKEADAEEDGKTVSLIIHSSDNINWKLSKGMSADGCGDPSVVEWKDKKLMMMTACDGGRRRVYESADKGDSWTEALGTLSRVWGNKHKGPAKGVTSGFITATIDGVDNNRDVMLVTLPVYSKKEKNGNNNRKGELHLWLTDNTHIVDIGPVSEEDEDAAASSLLYKSGNNKKEELIALYEKKKGGEDTTSFGMVSVLLTAQLQRVKEVLTTWKNVDKRVSKLCPTSSATEDSSTDSPCGDITSTTGLVGFLSGDFSGNTWGDEYLGVNATVRSGVGAATEVAENSDGVTFQGSWAEWPVGEQGENQLYHFANYNFTLVATVSIHEVPEEGNSIPLMGVRLDGGEKKLMELSYDSEKKWRVLCCDGKIKKLKSTWEKDTTHQVAIVLQNGSQGSAYVDGQRVCGSVERELETTDSTRISHFYIGGDGGSAGSEEGVSVTVRNVLLYNLPFSFSGENADVEEDADSPSEDPESVEANSPSVEGEQIVALPATKPSEAPEEQAALRRPRKESEAQQITTEGKPVTTQQVPTASNSHAVGGATGDAGNVYRSGLLPLLLLLGLWGFAAL